MNLAELLAVAHRRLDDEVNPLWTDSEITGYLNEAQREAVFRADLLEDYTSGSTLLTMTVGDPVIQLNPAVYDVKELWYEDLGTPITLKGPEVLRGARLYSDSRPQTAVVETLPGGRIRLRFLGVPTVALQVRAKVLRFPFDDMAGDTDEPEIGIQHHDRLIDWVLFRCFQRRDRDTYDPDRARDSEDAFAASFGPRKHAKQQRLHTERAAHTIKYHPF